MESQKGVASAFGVELPVELTSLKHAQEQEMPLVQTKLTGVQVLLVEDNDLNAEIPQIQLEEYGMQGTRAADGKKAVQAYADAPAGTYDLILMDIMMLVMNGYEATKAIRSVKDRPDAHTIPIIAMTANAFAEDLQPSLDAGMNAHIAKPIAIDEAVKTITRNLNR